MRSINERCVQFRVRTAHLKLKRRSVEGYVRSKRRLEPQTSEFGRLNGNCGAILFVELPCSYLYIPFDVSKASLRITRVKLLQLKADRCCSGMRTRASQ